MSVNDASRIVIDDYRVMLQIVASLTGNCRGLIYYSNMFIVQATYCNATVLVGKKGTNPLRVFYYN
jgi:hypothetical protein